MNISECDKLELRLNCEILDLFIAQIDVSFMIAMLRGSKTINNTKQAIKEGS